MVKLDVLSRDHGNAIFNVSLYSPMGWVTKAILDHGAIFSTPIPVRGGLEKWNILLPDQKAKPSLFSELDRLGVVNINEIRQVEVGQVLSTRPTRALSDLSSRQTQVLKVAFENGYFESPKTMRSRELAELVGIAQSTFLEHLRKAQLKLMRAALRDS